MVMGDGLIRPDSADVSERRLFATHYEYASRSRRDSTRQDATSFFGLTALSSFGLRTALVSLVEYSTGPPTRSCMGPGSGYLLLTPVCSCLAKLCGGQLPLILGVDELAILPEKEEHATVGIYTALAARQNSVRVVD